MADYLTTDTELTSVADAIRTKGGTSASLVYPAGFISAIQDISTGTDVSDTTAVAADVRTGKYFYTSSGTKTQGTIADQAAQTITPGTTDQTIASGKYLTGNQTIKGDANLVAANIAKNVTIFGVTGTHEGGGGGGSDAEDGIIDRTISGVYENSRVTSIGVYAFYGCSRLTTASFPACTSIGNYAFYSCYSLTTASFPACTSIGNYVFNRCSNLTTVSFPVCTSIGSYAFYQCSSLTTASFPSCTNIGANAFAYCSSLTTASFPVCTSIGDSAFNRCSKLTTVSFPECTSMGNYAFAYCYSLTAVSFPACTSIGGNAFYSCYNLTTASFPSCTSIGSYVFSRCYKLLSLYLLGSSFVTLDNVNAFNSTPISDYTTSTGGVYGSIFVPASMLESYKTMTNWATYSARFVGV